MTPSLPFGDPNCGSRGQNSRDRATVPHDSGPGLPPLHQIIFFRHQQGPPPPLSRAFTHAYADGAAGRVVGVDGGKRAGINSRKSIAYEDLQLEAELLYAPASRCYSIPDTEISPARLDL